MSHRPDCPWENAECTCPKTPTRRYDDKRVCVHCLYCPLPAGVDVGMCANCSRRAKAEDMLAAVTAAVVTWRKYREDEDDRGNDGETLAEMILDALEDT